MNANDIVGVGFTLIGAVITMTIGNAIGYPLAAVFAYIACVTSAYFLVVGYIEREVVPMMRKEYLAAIRHDREQRMLDKNARGL